MTSHVDILDVDATLASIRVARGAVVAACAEWLVGYHRATAPRRTGLLAEGATIVVGQGYASVLAPPDRVQAVVTNVARRRWTSVWTSWPDEMRPAFQAIIDRLVSGIALKVRGK